MIIVSKLFSNRLLRDIGFLTTAAFLLVLPMIIGGIPSGNDLQHHFRFALGIQEGISNGIVFPTWDAFANQGFGDAGLRFYPPLSYIFLNVFVGLTNDWYFGSILTILFFFLVGGIGVYLWARKWFPGPSAVFGAIVYMSLPYHVNQIYNAFFYAEFAAAAFVPFCFLIIDRISTKPSLVNSLLLGSAYSVVILTHLPTGLMLSVGLLVYALLVFGNSGLFQKTLTFVSGIGIGLLLSGFYLIRLMTEVEYLRHSQTDFTNYDYDFRRNFLLSYFYSRDNDYLDRSLWFGDIMLVISLSVAVPFAFAFFRSKTERTYGPILAVSGLLIASVFFATPFSSILWSNIPTLAKIQFPFRWMGLITLASAFLVAAGYGPAIEYFRNHQRAKAVLLFALIGLSLSFTSFQIIRPAITIEATEFRQFIRSLRKTDSCECWWPVWAKREAFQRPERINTPDRNSETIKWEPLDREFRVGPGDPVHARIGGFYYPHWKATVNGDFAVVSSDDDGSILVEIPSGSASIRLGFEEPFVSRLAVIVSVSTLAFIFILFAFTFFQSAARIRKANS